MPKMKIMWVKRFIFLFIILFLNVLNTQAQENGATLSIDEDLPNQVDLSLATKKVVVEQNNFEELLRTPLATISVLYFKKADPNQLPNNFSWVELKGVSTLSIDCKECTSLPAGIGQLKNVTNLNLYLGALKVLPKSIENLRYIEEFTLTTSASSFEFKGTLENFYRLKKMNVTGDELTSVPNSLFTAPNVKELKIWTEKLETFPDNVYKMSQIRSGYFRFNALSFLPEGISSFKKLSTLKLSFGGKKLPSDFSQLEKLNTMELFGGELLELPEGFGQLPELSFVSIFVRGELVLSEDFGDLKKIKLLELHVNHIRQLPKSFENFKLSKLELKLSSLPAFSGPIPSVEKLTIESAYMLNRNKEWKAHVNEKLDLSFFPNLKQLHIVKLNLKDTDILIPENNKIEILSFFECQLEEFPKQMKSLQHCHTINVGKQPITTIPDFVFQLPALNRLSITKKYIEKSLLGKYQKNGKVKIVEAR